MDQLTHEINVSKKDRKDGKIILIWYGVNLKINVLISGVHLKNVILIPNTKKSGKNLG